MRILVADDHKLVRDTIFAHLEREPDIEASAAFSMEEAGSMIEHEGPFDLVLLDYEMPDASGLEGLRFAMRLNGGKQVALILGAAD